MTDNDWRRGTAKHAGFIGLKRKPLYMIKDKCHVFFVTKYDKVGGKILVGWSAVN